VISERNYSIVLICSTDEKSSKIQVEVLMLQDSMFSQRLRSKVVHKCLEFYSFVCQCIHLIFCITTNQINC